ncbi:MAG: ATP-dependent zinc metalloprotease FtsH, partial [Fibrobacter sp.]|nr:ATP-dependent zinc metalloprotease FtsH [Fibrobacter sp.]
KTLLARAVAGEAGVPFFSMSGSDFVEMFVGVGASRVRDLFETGKKNAPCILFIDEIDAVGRQRGAGLGGGHDEREQTLNQLLVEMDGFTANEGVILIAATNRPDVLDKALLRPGRFDRQIVVGLPDLKGREEILKVHLKKRKVPLAPDVDVKAVAKGTPGLAGADLENLVNEAALLAARFNNKKVTMLDFEEARDKLSMGAERRTLLMTDEEKRHTAYHEAGHALMTLLCKHSDPLHKITIIPRGRALGVTMSLPERDQVSYSREYAEERIMIMMSGRLAELIFFNHQSTGASNDIQRATELARKMVTEWGFDEEIGPVCYSRADGEVFLGREISKPKEMSEMMAEKIDNAINNLIKRMDQAARKLIEENKDKLIDLAEALFEFEVLDREEIDRVMAGEKLTGTKKSRQYQAMEELAKKREEENTPPPDPGNPPPVAPITDVQPAPATGNETATNSVKESDQQ